MSTPSRKDAEYISQPAGADSGTFYTVWYDAIDREWCVEVRTDGEGAGTNPHGLTLHTSQNLTEALLAAAHEAREKVGINEPESKPDDEALHRQSDDVSRRDRIHDIVFALTKLILSLDGTTKECPCCKLNVAKNWPESQAQRTLEGMRHKAAAMLKQEWVSR